MTDIKWVEDLEDSAYQAGMVVERNRILDLMRARVEECIKLSWITDAQALTAMMKEIAGDE